MFSKVGWWVGGREGGTCGRTWVWPGRLNKAEEMHSSGSVSQTLARPQAHVHTVTYWGGARSEKQVCFPVGNMSVMVKAHFWMQLNWECFLFRSWPRTNCEFITKQLQNRKMSILGFIESQPQSLRFTLFHRNVQMHNNLSVTWAQCKLPLHVKTSRFV